MHFSEYQRKAAQTSQLDLTTPEALLNALLGLIHEAGSIAYIEKKHRLKAINRQISPDLLREEMGDLLWYLAAISTACGLDLEDVAASNLGKATDRHGDHIDHAVAESLADDVDNCIEIERFPRIMTFGFQEESRYDGTRVAAMELVHAEPNHFPQGPVQVEAERPDGTRKQTNQGFRIPMTLGNRVTDNSRRIDGYRFHDALHLGFLAVLGWSPSMRYLLSLKRRSCVQTDHSEDGARAIFAEEGLTAILARMAEDRDGFRHERNIDEETIFVVKQVIKGLEVDRLPSWHWRRAINQGFMAMNHLIENSGGFLTVDLDRRHVLYRKDPPAQA